MVTKHFFPGVQSMVYGEVGFSTTTLVDEDMCGTRPQQSHYVRISIAPSQVELTRGFPFHLLETHKRLLGLKGRSQNWDGQGAAAIDSLTVTQADQLLWELSDRAIKDDSDLPEPSVGVSPDGAVGFEWSTPEVYVSVECIGKSRSVYVRTGGEEIERSVRSMNDLWSLIHDPLQLIAEQSSASA